jgi:ketosteroid isomerase-like protein
MRAEDNLKIVRRLQAAYAAADIEVIDHLVSDDAVFHIPGCHPLSGTYVGKTEVFGYMGKVATLSEGADGGFEVHSLTGDDDHVVALVTGTIEHDGVRFVRPTVHVFHVNGTQVTEFWEASLDQQAEDQFWINAISGPTATVP